VLWAYPVRPSDRHRHVLPEEDGRRLELDHQRDQAMLLIVIAARGKQISYNFLFFLAGCSRSRAR
jgi:hypothetical protein